MVYKKYITRGGKTYGPYIYHSKRVDGKVVSEYRGSGKTIDYKKYIWAFLGVFVVLAIFFIFFSGKGITGNVALDLQANYNKGEPLDGVLSFSLKKGELIPASTKLVFENEGSSYEYSLSDILSEKTVEGDFYIEGKNIEGTGTGYGKEGKYKNPKTVSFILDIYSSDETGSSEIPEEVEKQNESGEAVEEIVEEEDVEDQGEPSVETPVETITPSITGGVITGGVIFELSTEISGEVSTDNPFAYELAEGQTVELRPKSVKVGSDILPENVLNINFENNQVIVTTDYSVKESGFGEDYLGDNLETFTIEFSGLGLVLEEGELKISLVYSEEEILSIKTILEDDSVVEGQVLTEPEVEKQNESGEAVEEEVVEETNDTLEEIVEEEVIFSEEISELSLTEQERQILLDEFGNISVETIRNEVIEDKLVIGYQLREYRIEYVYDYTQNSPVLEQKAENDRILWLREIVRILSKEEVIVVEPVESPVNETYEI